MDHLQAKETVCNYCNEVFPSKGKYQYHFRRVHQNKVRMHGTDQEQTITRRFDDEKFVCICDKGYHSGQSLHRHQKNCQQWKDYQASHELDSDFEILIQGNFIRIYILIYRISLAKS